MIIIVFLNKFLSPRRTEIFSKSNTMIEISLVVIIILTWMYFLHKIWVYSFKIKPLDLHVKKLNEERQYEIKRLKHGIQVIIVNCNIDFIENTHLFIMSI